MGTGEKRDGSSLRADAKRNRERILAAAAEVFAERGLDASLDQVAEHAGVGVGTVYRRFPDREVLIEELFESRLDRLVEMAEECAAMEDSWQGLTTFIARGSLMMGENLAVKELMTGSGDISLKLATEPRARLAPIIESMVKGAKDSGQLRPDFDTLDVPLAELMLSRVIEITGPVDPEVWRRHLGMFIDGMRAEGATPLLAPAITGEQYTEALVQMGKRTAGKRR